MAPPVELPVVLAAAADPRVAEAAAPPAVAFPALLSAAELAAAEVEATAWEAEWLEQAAALADAEPPAPVAATLALRAEIPAVAPGRANPISEIAAVPMPGTVLVQPLKAELTALRARYIAGPDPRPKPEPAPAPAAAPAPAPKPEPKPEARAAAAAAAASAPAVAPAAPPKARPASARPPASIPSTMVARGNAVPVEVPAPAIPESAPAPAAEPKVIPIRKPEPVEAPLLAPATGGFWSNASAAVKGGICAVLLVVVGGGGYLMFRPSGQTAPVNRTETLIAQPLIPLGGAGWASNWGGELPLHKGRQISIFRPTMAVKDYRVEIEGQIERKAIGWILRAKDPKNYYVMKLEWRNPGEDMRVALVRYTVRDGDEKNRTEVLLPSKISMTTTYKIRTDVKGTKFNTWVNGELIDSWSDGTINAGGAGLYVDKGERALVKSTNMAAL